MDSDDLGPRAELDYWKKRMSCCNYLLDQLKSPEVSTVFGVLLMSKSKLIKVRLFFFFFTSNKVVTTVFPLSLKLCFFADMARIRYQDNRCIQRSQRQCQIPVQSGEVLRSLIQQWPCKKSVLYKRTHFIWQLNHDMSLYCENDATQIIFSSDITFEHTNMQNAVFFSPQVSMVDAIPGLINAIRMIHTISRYYSIPENIRSLFVKVAIFVAGACF